MLLPAQFWSRLTRMEGTKSQAEKMLCLRVANTEQREVSRSLSHEGASSTAAFCGLQAGLRTYRHFPVKGFLPTSASQPASASACIEVFVPVYRCGTVLDFHQIPYFYAGITQRTNSIRESNTHSPG